MVTKRIALGGIIGAGLSLLYVESAIAAESCGNVDTNIISCGSSDAIWSIFEIILIILATGVGLAAVGGLVYGAILYASARDDAGQITKAKTTIASVVVGIVLFAGM